MCILWSTGRSSPTPHPPCFAKKDLYTSWNLLVHYFLCVWGNIWLNIKVPVGTSCRKTSIFEFGVQNQNMSECDTKVNFEIPHTGILEFSILTRVSVWRIRCKMVFSFRNGHFELLSYTSTLQIFTNFKNLFLKINLWRHQWNDHISKNTMSNFKNVCTKIELRGKPFRN